MADAFVAAAASSCRGIAMNVGSDDHYSVNTLVGLLGGEVVYLPKRPGEPDCTFADTTSIREKLGWSPKVSFEQGVKNMLDVIDDWSTAPVWDERSIDKATKSWFQYLGAEKEEGK